MVIIFHRVLDAFPVISHGRGGIDARLVQFGRRFNRAVGQSVRGAGESETARVERDGDEHVAVTLVQATVVR